LLCSGGDQQRRGAVAEEREQGGQDDEVFDRQYQVYKESYEQRGMSEGEADAETAEKLETGAGERAGSHRDRD
jgi:hypothetical protein